MPPNPSVFQKSLRYLHEKYSGDVGKSLIHLGALSWVLSSLAQVTMLATNKNIENKEKKFLIPQELADGAVNVGLYYGITQGLKSYTDKMMENGKWMLKSTRDMLVKTKQVINANESHLGGIFNFFEGHYPEIAKRKNEYTGVFFDKCIEELEGISVKGNEVSYPKTNKLYVETGLKIAGKEHHTSLLNSMKEAQLKHIGFKNGVGVAATLIGSFIACNILTPIARNAVGNAFQKKHLDKKQPVKKENTQPAKKLQISTTYYSPISNAYNMFKI